MTKTILIKEKFSKAAESYDKASVIQKQIADGLIEKIKFLYLANRVLDIGMGTGYLLQRIRLLYPELKLYGLDCASGMLEIAKKTNISASYIQADARKLPFAEKIFDIVLSNVSYQWVGNLNTAFSEAKRVLTDKGKFYFTIFCQKTLCELREVTLEVSEEKIIESNIEPLGNLPNQKEILSILKDSGFSQIKEEVISIKYYYSDVQEILVWLKNIGANRYWSKQMHNGLSGRAFIDSIRKKYQERFSEKGKIFATFEVLFVEATTNTNNCNAGLPMRVCNKV